MSALAQGFLIFVCMSQVLLLMAAAYTDVLGRYIPNEISLALVAFGACAQLAQHGPLHLAEAMAITLVLGVLLTFLHGRLGGGDIKLLTAMSLGMTPISIIWFLTATAIAGGVLALMHLAMRRLPRPLRPSPDAPSLLRLYVVERWRILRHAPLPYGVAIAAGGIWTVLMTQHIGM
jgi:prepilin peptidase CpaA